MDAKKLTSEFIALFRESVVIQGTLSLMVAFTVLWLYANGREVPQELLNMFYAVAGLWLGGKLTLRPVVTGTRKSDRKKGRK